jgi:hypothetical protein
MAIMYAERDDQRQHQARVGHIETVRQQLEEIVLPTRVQVAHFAFEQEAQLHRRAWALEQEDQEWGRRPYCCCCCCSLQD